MSRYSDRGRSQRGFSLLEVLVALAVLALALGVLLQSFATGTRAVMVSDQYNQALALAQARVAEVGLVEPLRPGVTQGGFGIFSWRLEISPYPEASGTARFTPFVVRSQVTWPEFGSSRQLSLSTLRLGPVDRS